MQVTAIQTRVFKEGESLAEFVSEHLPKIPENSIITVVSKVVALSEKRTLPPLSKAEMEKLIKKESTATKKTPWVWLTLKDGMIMANAGIDDSNGNGRIILLPKDSYASAKKLRAALMKKHGLKNLGVVITDSRLFPLRAGVTGSALGYAGFKGLRDYRGKKDIFGRELRMTQTNVADGLATASTLLTGEGAECQPIALITDASVEFTDRIKKGELIFSIEKDLYGPLFKKIGFQ